MASITFKGNAVNTNGELPKTGQKISATKLVKNDLSVVSLEDFGNKRKVLSFFPSIDTGVCQTSVRKFNEIAADLPNTVVLNISPDLPFANSRFCGAEGIKNCESLSGFRSSVGSDLGLILQGSPLEGLYARAIIVLNENNEVVYTELVPEVTHEVNYDAAIQALK